MNLLGSYSAGSLDADLRQMAWKARYAREFVRAIHPNAELVGMYREGATGVWIARFETDPNARSSRQVEVVCGGSMFITEVAS